MLSDSLVIVMADQPIETKDWLPTAAAILAAVAAFVAAFFGPVAQKRQAQEQRIADARHVWLNELRDRVAQALVAVTEARDRRAEDPIDPRAVMAALNTFLLNAIRVRLMLDSRKPHHVKLATALDNAIRTVSPKNPQHANYSQAMVEVEEAAMHLLDEAWTRIKSGR